MMMTTTRVDIDYFEWLTSQIAIPNEKTYSELFSRMHETEFVWTVPNDDNRIGDALDLRSEFANGAFRAATRPVSVLEVLVALSRRVAWVAGGDAPDWAWTLIENLRLERSFDPLTKGKRRRLENILEALVWRTYERDGRGGFFPLVEPHEDQTKVEIWYQMNAYVNEIQE
jgi:hypothetical protein